MRGDMGTRWMPSAPGRATTAAGATFCTNQRGGVRPARRQEARTPRLVRVRVRVRVAGVLTLTPTLTPTLTLSLSLSLSLTLTLTLTLTSGAA